MNSYSVSGRWLRLALKCSDGYFSVPWKEEALDGMELVKSECIYGFVFIRSFVNILVVRSVILR